MIKCILKIGVIYIALSLCLMSDAQGQIGRLALSPFEKIEQKIGLTTITITYCRPSQRGRTIFGDLVPYDTYWRTGANRNTTLEVDEEIYLGDQLVKPGKYALFTKPNPESWEVILYDDTDNWDVPWPLDTSKIVASIQVVPSGLETALESLKIEIGEFTNYNFDLNIAWDQTQVSVPIKLETRTQMDKKIQDQLGGPNYADYYLAAVYELESGGDYKQGIQWIDKAIEVKGDAGWWDLRVKVKCLMKIGQIEAAKEMAIEGHRLATLDERPDIVAQYDVLLETLSSM